MRLEFDPHRTRNAVNRVATMFASALTPNASLQELFDKVAKLDFTGLQDYAKRIRGPEMDLVCDNYHKSRDPRVLTGIAGLLSFQEDRRFFAVFRLAFFFIPTPREIQLAQELWNRLKDHVPTALHDRWLTDFLTADPPNSPLKHAIGAMERRQLDLARLGDRFYRTPLFQELTDHLFGEGVASIRVLTAEPAGIAAETYLRKSDTYRLANYLNHYPAESWQPGFLEEMVLKSGIPDRKIPFYSQFDDSVLWGIRQRLFRSRLRNAGKANQHETYWLGKLHYLSELKTDGKHLEVQFGPYTLTETETQSELKHRGWTQARTLSHDQHWEEVVDKLFQEIVGW